MIKTRLIEKVDVILSQLAELESPDALVRHAARLDIQKALWGLKFSIATSVDGVGNSEYSIAEDAQFGFANCAAPSTAEVTEPSAEEVHDGIS